MLQRNLFRSISSFGKRNFTSSLILGEHNNSQLSENTKSCITAAQQISGNDISVLVAGLNCENVANEASKIKDVKNVIYCDNEMFSNSALVENFSNLLVQIQKEHEFSHILAGLSSFSRDCIARVAGMLNRTQISDVTKIFDDNTFERSIYAGNAVCRLQFADSSAKPKLLTTRVTSFPFNDESSNNNAMITNVTCDSPNYASKEHIADELSDASGPSLTSASIVVSGGRGMKNGENFQMLYDMCELLGDSAVGASRAAVDAGYVGNDLQVGQTGKNVAPNLYIAVGISGAIQHVAGMKDSKLIVAINNDPEAPIFSIADYGLCQDLFTAVPELNVLIENSKK